MLRLHTSPPQHCREHLLLAYLLRHHPSIMLRRSSATFPTSSPSTGQAFTNARKPTFSSCQLNYHIRRRLRERPVHHLRRSPTYTFIYIFNVPMATLPCMSCNKQQEEQAQPSSHHLPYTHHFLSCNTVHLPHFCTTNFLLCVPSSDSSLSRRRVEKTGLASTTAEL
jgi:hypothetical protein